MNLKNYILIGVIVLLIISVGLIIQSISNNSQKSSDATLEVYNILTDNNAEVLSIKEVSGLKKVTVGVKTAQGAINAQEVYITPDGKYMTSSLVNVEEYKKKIQADKNFISCLRQKNLVIFGQSNNQDTISQLNLLGVFSTSIYFDCLGDNLRKCVDVGVSSIPAVFYNSQNFTGVRDIKFFEELTGCKY